MRACGLRPRSACADWERPEGMQELTRLSYHPNPDTREQAVKEMGLLGPDAICLAPGDPGLDRAERAGPPGHPRQPRSTRAGRESTRGHLARHRLRMLRSNAGWSGCSSERRSGHAGDAGTADPKAAPLAKGPARAVRSFRDRMARRTRLNRTRLIRRGSASVLRADSRSSSRFVFGSSIERSPCPKPRTISSSSGTGTRW